MLGILELAGKGSGFLRRREAGYLASNGDVHVGERAIRQFELRAGDEIDGVTRSSVGARSTRTSSSGWNAACSAGGSLTSPIG